MPSSTSLDRLPLGRPPGSITHAALSAGRGSYGDMTASGVIQQRHLGQSRGRIHAIGIARFELDVSQIRPSAHRHRGALRVAGCAVSSVASAGRTADPQ